MNMGKAVAIDAASTTTSYWTGYACNEMGLPLPLTLMFSMGVGMGTSQNKGDNMIKDFIKEKAINDDVIAKYQGIAGEDVVKMWKEYGEGSFLNGYLRIINPDDYAELVRTSYFKGDLVVPLFVSAFGDVIVFDGEFLTSIYYKEHDFKVMNKGLALFFRYLEVDGYKKDYFDLDLFEEAKKFVGILKNDECYCFVPVLPLGGKKSVKTLEIGKTREHIEVITQLVGGVGMV